MLNKKYFFIGIGGIGMSSIAQFLHDKGNIVFGYDQSNNRSIEILLKKGIAITNKLNLEDNINDFLKIDFKDDIKISFKSLANHTSGLPRMPSNFESEKYYQAVSGLS